MQLPERKRVRTLPCPCPRALCSALPLGRGMIPALDHLLVRLLIIQPWIGTQALGLGHFGHPPLGHLQHVRGLLSLSESGSSRVKSPYCYCIEPSTDGITSRWRSRGRASLDNRLLQECQRPSILEASQAGTCRQSSCPDPTTRTMKLQNGWPTDLLPLTDGRTN